MNTMLLHDFAYVPVSAERVCDRIMAEDGEWLAPLAAAAMSEGDALRLRIGPFGAVPLLAKTVSLEVGEPLKRDEVTVVPLTWKATATPGLFPVMSADLEVVALDAELTQLTLRGRYEPPLGAVGTPVRPAPHASHRRGECPFVPQPAGCDTHSHGNRRTRNRALNGMPLDLLA